MSDTRPDPHGLSRFVEAQAGCHDSALAELRAGKLRMNHNLLVFPGRALGAFSFAGWQ